MHNHNKLDFPDIGSTAVCPVMKSMAVDREEAEKAGLVREFKGKKYYFCCNGCVKDFERSPEQYAR